MSFSLLQIFMYADKTLLFMSSSVQAVVGEGGGASGWNTHTHNNALESTEIIISNIQRLLNHHRGLFLLLESICCLAPVQFATINL